MTPLEETTNNQRLAADPNRSAFVMANAGSGKTRVLTDRVARLLLADASPEKILCITFTKAAAAEMAARLFSVLGKWALASDEELIKALAELEGEGAKAKTASDLAKARRLFAKALETPGGLKIQTIHSFCESVLRRFPIEAGAPPGFSVIEDTESAVLFNQALDWLAESAREEPEIAAAFDRLASTRREDALRKLLLDGARTGLDEGVSIDDALKALAREMLIDPATNDDQIKDAFIQSVSTDELQRAHDGLAAEGNNPIQAAGRLLPYFSAANLEQKWDALCVFLLTEAGTLRKQIATKVTDKHDPWVKPYLAQLLSRFGEAIEQLKTLSLYHDTAALLRLTTALRARYVEAKAARAALDFDDLVARARKLFANTKSAWIMYKLDAGVDHILIDEAQDTSPAQWAVVESLFEEYFSGAGAREMPRSFFAVGDLKQSIYSFQGAAANLFSEKVHFLGNRLGAVTDFKNLSLVMSFRTTAPVLKFVDAAFDNPAALEGLGEETLAHAVKREGEAGLVELWPLTPRPKSEEFNPWDAPVDAPTSDHPSRVLCDRIASTIKGWLDQDEILQSRDRPIRAGDIMILVQSRGKLFGDIIQRLSAAGVSVAGPDRLKMIEDPAVEDLLSYARFALTQSDDLSLAEILKSPLFGFDDDRDLFPLAAERGHKVSLWAALERRASENPTWARAAAEIETARKIARKEGPYAFFSHVLEAGEVSGRQRFFERLGEASGDAINELLRQALDFENGAPRSVRAFLARIEKASGEIKREPDRDNDCVRVMTAHGAKGLEADIVFLLDAHREMNTKNIGPLLDPAPDAQLPSGLKLLAGSKADDVALSAEARAEITGKQFEEYRRLFYVAATRARDRLYICGIEQGNNAKPDDKEIGVKSWHALAGDAFDRLAAEAETETTPFWEGSPKQLRRLKCEQINEVKPEENTARPKSKIAIPPWLFKSAPTEAAPPRLAPSRLIGEDDGENDAAGEKDFAYSPIRSAAGHEDKYFRGRTLHRLLELLPGVASTARSDAAARLLARLVPDIDIAERVRWREEVLRVLTDPAFADVFAPGSRAETPIVGRLKSAAGDISINGQIDRLAISPTQVLVVDYKTNRPPPADPADVDPAYLRQMAAYRALLQEIYPTRQINCALLWTYDARLMALPGDMLDHAFARIVPTG